MRRGGAWLAAALSLAACKGSGSDRVASEALQVSTPVVIGIANIDDDAGKGGRDWRHEDPDDPDLSRFTVTPGRSAQPTRFVRLALDLPAGQRMRVYHDGAMVLDHQTTEVLLPPAREPFELAVEFRSFNQEGALTIQEFGLSDAPHSEITVPLKTGPLLLSHHLQPSEYVTAMDVDLYWPNPKFVAGYEASLGSLFETVPGSAYDYDVWMQDAVQVGYQTAPGGLRVDVVIDSIRGRGLADYATDVLAGPDVAVEMWGEGEANTLDSFGNLEVSPPVEGFPFGRIYYGGRPGFMPVATELFDFLEQQEIQAPFVIDTSWLCVAHVDEIMAFIPDSSAPRGFRLVFTDTDLAWQILDDMPPQTLLSRYDGPANHNYTDVAEMVADLGLRNLNDEIQALHLDPILAQLTDELDLADDEIIRIPGLFEEACGSLVAALIPGMANLYVANQPDRTRLFLADPFVRTDLKKQDDDPFIHAVADALPNELELVFLDDWETYHLGLGEVHCGTNGIRTPTTDWWTIEGGLE